MQFCLQDGRCQAGVGLDSWLLPVMDNVEIEGPTQPFMFIGTPLWLGEANQARGDKIFNNLSNDGYSLALANTAHFDFYRFAPIFAVDAAAWAFWQHQK